MVWFINGNISKEQSIDIVEKARSTFDLKIVNKSDLSEVRAIRLNPSQSLIIEIPL